MRVRVSGISDDALSMIMAALRRLEDKTDRLQQGQTSLQQSLAAMREDVWVNMARADRVADAGENTRSEVRLMALELSAVWRKVHRLEEAVQNIEQNGKGGRER